MKKELVIELIGKANDIENYCQHTNGVEYYSTDLDFSDMDEEDLKTNALYQLIENDKILPVYMDRSIFSAYLGIIGKTPEQINMILDVFYRYNNMDLDYFHFGTFSEIFDKLEYPMGYANGMSDYEQRKEACTILKDICRRKVSLIGYQQERDIRYCETAEQLDYEDNAYRENEEDDNLTRSQRFQESYAITENYVCSYAREMTLSVNMLKMMGLKNINPDTGEEEGLSYTLFKSSDLTLFDNIIFEGMKHFRLCRIPGIEGFAYALKKIYVNDGNLTKSDIEAFDGELNKLITFVEDPESFEYMMRKESDVELFDPEDCIFLYTNVCKILDLTKEDLERIFNVKWLALQYKWFTESGGLEAYAQGYCEAVLFKQILDNMDIEIETYYDDNLDYQDDDAEGVDYTNSDNVVMTE